MPTEGQLGTGLRQRTDTDVESVLRARLRSGDPESFGQLFDDQAGVIFRHAVRMTGDRATAEDVVSLTFLEAWRLRERLEPEGDSLRPWLLGIATNVLRNTARAARRHAQAMARMPAVETVPDFAEELVGRMADAEQIAATRAALAKLRRNEEEVIALCVWAGLDYAAAAQALGVPVGTVRSRLARARAKLRTMADAELRSAARRDDLGELDAGTGQVSSGRRLVTRSMQEDRG